MRYSTYAVLWAVFSFSANSWCETDEAKPVDEPLSARAWTASPTEASDPEPSYDVNQLIQIAQEEPRPAPGDALTEVQMNIFDVNKIELIDIQELGRSVDSFLTGDVLRMSLNDCVAIALENNQEILVSFFEPQKSYADLIAARGEFDPTLALDYSWTESSLSASPQIEAFGGFTSVESESWTGQISLNGRSHWGLQYGLNLSTNFETGTFSNFTGQYRSAVTLSLTQPLLRGRGRHYNLANIRRSKNAQIISDEQLNLTVLNALGDVMKAYWDLVGTIENLQVQEESLANAERLVDINERKLDIGTAAVIEVISAKAGVALRISDFVTARTAIADAEDVLKNQLNMRDGDFFSFARIVPVDRPSEFEFDWDPKRSMSLALENRPDIHTAELAIENAQIDRRRARSDVLPQIDLRADITYGGRDFKLDQSYTGLRNKDDDLRTYGITGSIPLGNRTAKGNYLRSKLTVSQEEQRLLGLKMSIMQGVRIAGRGVVSSLILIESNQTAVTLQDTNVLAEEQRLRLGTSTSQQVLDVQEELTRAQTQEVQARINAEKALIDLQVAEGTLLKNLGIEFDGPDVVKPPNMVEIIVAR